MEIDITEFFNNATPADYSASRAELGDDAGRITWAHAPEDAPEWNHLDTDEKRAEFRGHVEGFGAWDREEIDGWTDDELNALFIQLVSGDIRECLGLLDGGSWDWAEYERLSADGQINGRLFPDDGCIFYCMGE